MSVIPHVVPTGAEHEVGHHDLFFSATDNRGVITQANEVFSRLARHPHDHLIGAPHNVIRHPDMPAGAFKIVWDSLADHRPTCAYVRNLAGDGSAYWAFATLLPVSGGYLSLRTRPLRTVRLEKLDAIYQGTRELEREARREGATASQAAQAGAEHLGRELKSLGVDSYSAFVLESLPDEVVARPTAQERSALHRVGAYAGALSTVDDLTVRLHGLASDLYQIRTDDGRLSDLAGSARGTVGELHDVLEQCCPLIQSLGEQAPVVAQSAPALQASCRRVEDTMRDLVGHAEQLVRRRAELRFSAALALLESECIASYTVGVIEGREDRAESADAVAVLAEALHSGLFSMAEDVRLNADLAEEINDALTSFHRIQQTLGQWRRLIERYELTNQVGDHLPRLDEALARGVTQLEELKLLSDRFSAVTSTFDTDRADADLMAVEALVRQFGA